MLPKPGTRTARLHRTIQRGIWAHSFWAPPRERFSPMGVAIGGRHIVMVASTIPTRGHTVAPITGATVIIIQLLTMTLLREPTDGSRLHMARTDRQQEGPVTTLTRVLMPEAPGFRPLTAPGGATMGPYSTANGTVAGISGSQGGKAAGASTAWENTAVGKTASGNMYAGHDGNVYKNTGNGWQKYDNGSWNSVSKPQPNWQGAENSQQRTANGSYQQGSQAPKSKARSRRGGRL